MTVADVTGLVTTVGFPVALCFVLLKYVLQNMEKQLSQLDETVKELAEAVRSLRMENNDNSHSSRPSNHRRRDHDREDHT
ncbi:hypothetical protein [Paenibacillus kandeliae]|uniref:hypothetical protein n=1 Tax=Paenibacillus kandeliae TaxID=3231269 RepID=UPI0034592756